MAGRGAGPSEEQAGRRREWLKAWACRRASRNGHSVLKKYSSEKQEGDAGKKGQDRNMQVMERI